MSDNSTVIRSVTEELCIRQGSVVTVLRVYGTGPAGDGSVVGPSGATAGNLPAFEGSTGQRLRDSGNKPADFDAAGSAAEVQATLTTHATTHPAPKDRDARNAIAGANADITSLAGLTTPLSVGQGGTGAATAAAALTALGAQAGAFGTALPTGGDIVTGQIFRLTAADGVALAAPGRYVHDASGWACDQYQAAYALGDLGATPSHTLIAGASFAANANVEVSTWTLTLSVLGIVAITLANAGGVAVAPPAMAGRTTKLLGAGAWDAVTEPLSKVLIADDGTYLWISSREGA